VLSYGTQHVNRDEIAAQELSARPEPGARGRRRQRPIHPRALALTAGVLVPDIIILSALLVIAAAVCSFVISLWVFT